jgi:hypothetical protein
MQVVRSQWERFFNGSYIDNAYPGNWIMCKWDSLAWNWQINLHNGLWWLDSALVSRMIFGDQSEWPDSCSFTDCDTVPDTPNKEDLANYGYHSGEPHMNDIKTADVWRTNITESNDEYAKYCKNVRKWKYRPNRDNLW